MRRLQQKALHPSIADDNPHIIQHNPTHSQRANIVSEYQHQFCRSMIHQ